MDPKSLLLYLLESSDGSYPEPDQFSQYHPVLLLWDP
jgi:hypothetical protein